MSTINTISIASTLYRSDDEKLELNFLSMCSLNDFEAFEEYLFTPEERGMSGMDRFKKFIHVFSNNTIELSIYDWGIDVPFSKPTEFVEYQINHYVLWGTIAYREENIKPLFFYEFNTGEKVETEPYNFCYACEWCYYMNEWNFSCVYCPIWNCLENDFMCERDDGSNYVKWTKNKHSPSEYKQYAINLMEAIWTLRE